MTLEEAILYAQQRMREIGKQPDEYHYEPVFVCPTQAENTAGTFTISAYNEIYIPIHSENLAGVFILADNSGFSSSNPLDCGAPEFTGLIYFKRIDTSWSFATALAGGGIGGGGMEQGDVTITSAEFLRVVY